MRRFREKPVMLSDVLSEKNPVRKAYLLGYFFGYSGHLAWSGWSRELKQRIFEEAELSNVLHSAIEAFKQGRREGSSDRELDIMLGIYRPPVKEIELVTESIRVSFARSRIFGMLSLKLTGEARFLDFIRFSDTRSHLALPSFLRRP